VPFSVTAAVDNYVLKLEEPREPDGMWHPSGLFGCPRATMYQYRGVEQSNPPDERARRVFRVGHILHEFVQTAIADDTEILAFYAEVKILDEERRIKGHVDGLAKLANGTWIVLEFKTINSMAFRFNDLPKEDHKGQASVYLMVLRDHGGIGQLADGTEIVIPPMGDELNRATFVYISKDDLKIEEFTMLWTPAKYRVIAQRLLVLETHAEAGTLPPRLPYQTKTNKKTGKSTTSKHYLCGYCSWADQCWDVDKEGVPPA
jgi:hypothetical protein